MSKHITINLPVANLPKSVGFFSALGFSPNPDVVSDTIACFSINDATTVMLMTHPQFQQFTPKAVCDTTKAAEALFVLSCDSVEAVDDLVAKAVAAGGTADKAEDFGTMYTHGFIDPDGHGWGLKYMRA